MIRIGIVIICLCVSMIQANLHNPINSDDKSSIAENECDTTQCHIDRLRASLSILLYMNESVSPCDNFYEFVCGNYEKISNEDSKMPFTMTQKTSDQIVNKNLYHSIRKINTSTEKSRPRKLVKEFFDMCMDTETRDYRGTKSLLEIIKKLHGWPMMEGYSWNESNWRLENVCNKARKLGVPTDSFLLNIKPYKYGGFDPIPLQLLVPDTEFDKKRLSNPIPQDKGINGYSDFMMNIALKGFKISPSIAIPQIIEVQNFEIYLTKAFSKEKWMVGNITGIQQYLGNVNWNTVFNLSAYGIEIDNITETIVMPNIQYLKFLEFNQMPKRILANYQIWKSIQYATSYLNSDISQMKKDYIKTRKSVEPSVNDQWESCVQAVRKSLPHIADAIFIQDYLDKNIKNEVMEMIENIKEQFTETLNSASWLDKSTREWAMAKLNATKYLVAYPDEAYDNEKLDQLYEDFEIVDGDFSKTVLRFNYLSQKRIMAHYKTHNVTGYEELRFWIDTNAQNFIVKNTIQILAGILQDDEYNKNRPKYMSYGTVGTTIGHELSHSFDVDAIDYDEDGNENSEDLNTTVKAMYENRTGCLVDHYSRYKYPIIDLPVKSNLTVNENLADVNGIRLAYHGYQQWVKNHGPEPNLPYLNFTANQLYWISFAHSYCTAFKDQNVVEASYDEHPTNDVRVMGSVSNSPEFAADFNCPINSEMNPMNKCIFS